MTSPADRPFLFLDVDGPLIPFGSPSGPPMAQSAVDQGNPLLERLDPTLGPHLLALNCRLVWATTWGEQANEAVSPRLGLPRLPVVEWPASSPGEGPHGLHWKTPRLVEWAAGRPFIWIDDEIGAMDRLWVEGSHPGPSLLHRVDPARGLVDADFTVLADWLRCVVPGYGSGRML